MGGFGPRRCGLPSIKTSMGRHSERSRRGLGFSADLRLIVPQVQRFAPRLMPYASLRDFIARLESAGRLVRVKAPVSPILEMTEIQTRLLAEAGPAVLFEAVTHSSGGRYGMPALVNLFGTV